MFSLAAASPTSPNHPDHHEREAGRFAYFVVEVAMSTPAAGSIQMLRFQPVGAADGRGRAHAVEVLTPSRSGSPAWLPAGLFGELFIESSGTLDVRIRSDHEEAGEAPGTPSLIAHVFDLFRGESSAEVTVSESNRCTRSPRPEANEASMRSRRAA